MQNTTPRRRVGSVRRLASGRWQARVQRGVKADGGARVASATFDTKGEAEGWLAGTAIELGRRPDLAAGVTLRDVWGLYKADREGRLATKTLAMYTWYMEGAPAGNVGCWLDWLGDVDVSAIAPAMVQRRLDGMPRQKAKHAKTALSSVLTWAAREGLLFANPLCGHRFEYREDKPEEDPFDTDPFSAIEGSRDVWGADTALRCMALIRGLPLEPAWLACVGAGLRVEEALALRKMDVRRVTVGGHEVTQLAVHAARTDMDERKATKTARSRRIVGMLEPFGERYWELVSEVGERDALVCPVSAQNQNRNWRLYFDSNPKTHRRMAESRKVAGRLSSLPYIPLSKMRNTHVTIMAEAGVSDSINALMHGHTEMVERRNYLSPDMTEAAVRASERFKLVG